MEETSRQTFLRRIWNNSTSLPLERRTISEIMDMDDLPIENRFILLFILDKLDLLTIRDEDREYMRIVNNRMEEIIYTFDDQTGFSLVKFVSILPDTPTFDADAYREYWNTDHFIPDDYPDENDPACKYALEKAEIENQEDNSVCDYCPLGCNDSDHDGDYSGICNRPGVAKYNALLGAHNTVTRYGINETALDNELSSARNAIRQLADHIRT